MQLYNIVNIIGMAELSHQGAAALEITRLT